MVRAGLERLVGSPSNALCDSANRIGLVANPTSLGPGFERSVELLGARWNLVRLFGPEHGFSGEAQDGVPLADGVDRASGLPVYSLYGETRKPRLELLADLDVLLFDIQDVGLRWYTYLSTLKLVIEAVAEARAAGSSLSLLVLDRPNPLGGAIVEGKTLAPGYESFVGCASLPARHGLTLGELARLLSRNLDSGLEVLPMEGWNRRMLWPETGLPWIPPSPNLPGFDSCLAYAATCILEGTNVSEGRGTTRPFETFGAPWVDGPRLSRALRDLGLPGLAFRPLFFTPRFSKHAGESCGGVMMHVLDPRATDLVGAGYAILRTLSDLWPGDFEPLPSSSPGSRPFLDLISGDSDLREGASAAEAASAARSDAKAFLEARKPFLLYPETGAATDPMAGSEGTRA